MTSASLHPFPTAEIYAPAPTEIERLAAHRDEVRRNHIWLLGEVPKAIILGLTLAVLAPLFLLGLAIAVIGWLAGRWGPLILIVLAVLVAAFLFLWLVSLPFRLAGVVG